ncbi:protocadherin beta-15-like [Octopus sinensis]|uniref:Protocadherin beta-15-like n=1 Tax=Octopus sinensis TaxID=2607531 RepID=A0A7E6FBL7_9MOLL|nr:protocadherin beta-15-like [Octopus sinensis]
MLKILYLLFILNVSDCVDWIYNIKENQRPGIFIGDIAFDTNILRSNSAQGSQQTVLWFSQLQQEISSTPQLFNITKTGKLYTAQKLDAESLCKYNTECFKMVDVAVQNKLSFVKILELKIIIEDVNDNRPEFPVDANNLYFSETDGRGTIKSIPNAIDIDVGAQNSQITYHLNENLSNLFALSVIKKIDGTAKLGIFLQQKLDREIKDSYTLEVIAKDGGSPPLQGSLNVLISVTDENDNSPVFSQNVYNVSINDGYFKGTAIIRVSATDVDSGINGKVFFKFGSKTSSNHKMYFKVHKKSGEIFLLQKLPARAKKVYKLFVEATDGGNPPLSSTAIVLVYVINQQNNAPVIDMNFISRSKENNAMVSEAIKVGGFIAFVKVSDEDIGRNSEVSCDLQHEKLQLRSLGKNKYKIVVKNLINRETESSIESTIICEDKGSPPLRTERKFSIQVKDVNDIQPQFTKDTFQFLTYENEEQNFPVGFVNATDEDLGPGGQLSFSLFNQNYNILPFVISDFGFISATQSLDREQQDVYKFKVLVKDNGTPSLNNTANVIVKVMDKNDNAPYFTFPSVNPFSLEIHYQPQMNTDITTLRASDRDRHVNAFLRYEVYRGNDKQLFTVNPYTGVLSFSRPVYQNDAGSYILKLAVKDGGTPILSATTILSLTLTVSNTTAIMYTAEDTETDNRIHINLMIIIVVAAVIVSVAIVVSITVCILRKNNQRDVQYSCRVDDSNNYLGENALSEYNSEQISHDDMPVTVESYASHQRNGPTLLLRRDPHSKYESSHEWKGPVSGIQPQNVIQESLQEATVLSVVDTVEDHVIISREPFTEMSRTDSGHGSSMESTGYYEELPCQLEQVFNIDNVCLSQQPITSQKSNFKDCNDAKIIRVNSPSSSLLWNLPMRNSFNVYPKSLPSAPKAPNT